MTQSKNKVKLKDPLDEIFIEEPKINLTTAKIEIRKLNAKLKKIQKEFSESKTKFEKNIEILEKGEEHYRDSINYWITRYRELKEQKKDDTKQ